MLDENVLSDVTVVIPCFNEGRDIEITIKHLRRIGFKNILIVDDGSKDDTYSKAINQDVLVLRNKNNIGFNISLLKGLYEINTKYAFIPRPYHIFNQDSVLEFIDFGKKGNYSLLFSETTEKDTFSTSISSLLKKRYGIYIHEPLIDIAFINDDLLKKIKTETINNDFILFELIRLVIKNNLKLGTHALKMYNHEFQRNVNIFRLLGQLIHKLIHKDEYFERAFPKKYKESFIIKVKTDVLIAVIGYLIIRLIEIIISKYVK